MRMAILICCACLPAVAGCTTLSPQNIDEMLALYKEYDLPQPPDDAALCLWKDPGTCMINSKEIEYEGRLVFASEQPALEEPLKCFTDLSKLSPEDRKTFVPVEPSTKNAEKTIPSRTWMSSQRDLSNRCQLSQL